MSSPATQAADPHGLPLPGLDGSNPLGFLAALGVFRTLAQKVGPDRVRMKWIPSSGTVIPEIRNTAHITSEARLLEAVDESLAKKINAHPIQMLKQLNNSKGEEERRAIFVDSLAN